MGLDAGTRLALEATGQNVGLPEQMCASCIGVLASGITQGLRLKSEKDTREKDKMMAWKNRVQLIKTARGMMSQKAYSEAAVQYEKYIRILEMVYNVKKGELSPAVFSNSTRSKEITVIASVYWDLVRIYDTSPRYGERMSIAATKLAMFLPFSQIYQDIVRKADQFAKTAKNPVVAKSLLKAIRGNRGPCFIATAAFAETPEAVELLILRKFRDENLRHFWLGRNFIWLYYKSSPPLAHWIGQNSRRKKFVRFCITKLSRHIQKKLDFDGK
jgi:hypothetical protein